MRRANSTLSAPPDHSRQLDLVALGDRRSEEHTSELQSRLHLVCRLLLEKKKKTTEATHGPGVRIANKTWCDLSWMLMPSPKPTKSSTAIWKSSAAWI